MEDTSPEVIGLKLKDPRFLPTQREYEIWRDAEKEKSWFQPGEWSSAIGQAAKGVAVTAKKGLVGSVKLGLHPLNHAQTVLEGAASGTMGDLQMGKKGMEGLGNTLGKLASEEKFNKNQFLYRKLMETNEQAFPNGRDVHTVPLTFADIPAKTMQAWEQEYQEYAPKAEYHRFLEKRGQQLQEWQLSQSKEDLLPHIFGTPDHDTAELYGMVASPVSLATLGTGTGVKVGATALQRLTRLGLNGTAKALGEVFKAGEALSAKAGPLVKDGATAAAEQVVEAAPAVVINDSKPMIAPALRSIGDTLQQAKPLAKAFEAAGKAVGSDASRTGVLGTIANDGAAPKWMREAAGAAKWADPALTFTGRVAEGGVHGAAIGGTLGGLTDGKQGVLAGIGSGGTMGLGFSALGRVIGRDAEWQAKQQSDAGRWFLDKTPEEQSAIHAMKLSAKTPSNMPPWSNWPRESLTGRAKGI